MKQHKRAHRRHQSGYSLAEVMVAMAILTIVILAALTIYDRSNRMFNQGVQASDMQQSTRVAFDRLVSDIRLTGFDYDRDGIPFGAMAPTWQPNVSYVLGNQVQPDPANGYVYVCTVGGKSGASQPSWPTSPGSTVTDGSSPQITWQYQDLVHYQQPDEQIEYAGEGAITIRANFDYNTEVGPCPTSGGPGQCENGREQQLESSQFPLVTTDNDEIVTYVLKSNSGNASANQNSVVFYADTDRPRDVNPSTKKKETKITISGVDTTNNYPPYTLYRYTLTNDNTAAPVGTPIADNIRRLTFHYYTDTAGTAEILALPYGDGQYDASNPDQAIPQRDTRATIKSVRIDLVGMNPNMDAAFNDTADTAAPHYRKYELDSLIVPRNIGKHGLKEFNTTVPSPAQIKAVCSGACNGVYVTWAPPTGGGDVDSYNIVYDVGDCAGTVPGGGTMSCTSCSPGYSIAEDAGTNLAGYATKVTPGQIYRFSIQAVNKYGSATATNCIAVNVLNMDKPATPNDLQASGGTGSPYPSIANGIQLYWTPISLHDPSFNGTSCTDGTTKTEPGIVPGESVRYRVWRSKTATFTPGDATSKQVLSETTPTQPTVVAGKVMWLDQTAPIGSCETFYYRVQAVTVPCCNSNSMNQGGNKALATSAFYPDPASAPGMPGQSVTTATPAAPTGVGAVSVIPTCSGNCDVNVSWAKVVTDSTNAPMIVDRYIVNIYKKDPITGIISKIGTQNVNPTAGALVTSTVVPALDTNSEYQFTVTAVDCVNSPESSPPVPWPCNASWGTVSINIPNYGGGGTSSAPYDIQSPTTATVTFTGTVASIAMIVTEGATVIGTPVTSPANPSSPYTVALPKTDDGVTAKVHFTITGTGTSACAFNIDQWVIDQPPPPCALVDQNSDATVFSTNTAGNYVDIFLKNTSTDVLKPQAIYLTWNNANNGPAKFANGVTSVTFDATGTSPNTVTTSCSGTHVTATPSGTIDSIAANQQTYDVRVQFSVQSGKNITGNPIMSVCVQYQSPFGDIKTCSVAPNAGNCAFGSPACF